MCRSGVSDEGSTQKPSQQSTDAKQNSAEYTFKLFSNPGRPLCSARITYLYTEKKYHRSRFRNQYRVYTMLLSSSRAYDCCRVRFVSRSVIVSPWRLHPTRSESTWTCRRSQTVCRNQYLRRRREQSKSVKMDRTKGQSQEVGYATWIAVAEKGTDIKKQASSTA